jgi:hypothetical protein
MSTLHEPSDDDVGEEHLGWLRSFVRDAFNFSTRIRLLKAEFVYCTPILSRIEIMDFTEF